MPRQNSTGRARAHLLPLALLLVVIAVAAVTSLAAVLMLSPALLLLALLLAGRAPGEELLVRLRSRGRGPARRHAAVALAVRRHGALFARWTERMSASALAMRPPPAARASVIG